MAACGACKNLDGQDRRRPPHVGLKQVGMRKHISATTVGSVATYQCLACGSRLQLDEDANDRHSGWTLAREG